MHIAVVDSSRVVLKIISDMLKPRGYSVTCFLNSRDALSFMRDNADVGVLITSLEVQPISGIELCWSARLLARPCRKLFAGTPMPDLQVPLRVTESPARTRATQAVLTVES